MSRTPLVLSLRLAALFVLAFALFATPAPDRAAANYHLALVSEFMAGYQGDMNVQYIEIEMLLATQNRVDGTRFSVWNADGSEFEEIMLLDGNVPNHGSGVRWIMATEEFQALTGLEPDFIIPPVLPSPTGMFCWGGPDFAPPADEWDPAFPFLYTDCVAYGGYTGGNAIHPPPTGLEPGDGERALQRNSIVSPPPGTGQAAHLSAPPDMESFDLRCPTPENNAGEVVLMGADDDGDGLPNCHEEEVGSDPSVSDTDGDGFSDRVEYDAGSDPTDANSTPDGGPTPTPVMGGVFGDTNGDTVVSAIDATLILQDTAGLFSLESIALADVDCSEQLASLDALLILQFVSRLFAPPSQTCPAIGSFV